MVHPLNFFNFISSSDWKGSNLNSIPAVGSPVVSLIIPKKYFMRCSSKVALDCKKILDIFNVQKLTIFKMNKANLKILFLVINKIFCYLLLSKYKSYLIYQSCKLKANRDVL